MTDIHGASLWQPRWALACGTIISVKQHGACSVLSVCNVPDMTRFYSYFMYTPLQDIRCRRIWHIVLACHLHVHASVASELLAEAVASFLQTVKRRNLNQKMSTNKFVWTTQVKSIELQGMGGEEGILSMALHIHFHARARAVGMLRPKKQRYQSLGIALSSGARCVC